MLKSQGDRTKEEGWFFRDMWITANEAFKLAVHNRRLKVVADKSKDMPAFLQVALAGSCHGVVVRGRAQGELVGHPVQRAVSRAACGVELLRDLWVTHPEPALRAEEAAVALALPAEEAVRQRRRGEVEAARVAE